MAARRTPCGATRSSPQAPRSSANADSKPAGLRDVEAKLGTDRASLYYYVASKNELFQLVTQRAVTEVVVAAEAVSGRDADAETRLRDLIVTTVAKYEEHYPYVFVYIQEDMNRLHSDSLDEVWARTMLDLGHRFEAALKRILDDGIEDGTFVVSHPHLAMNTIIGAVNWTHRWLTPRGRLVGPGGRGAYGRHVVLRPGASHAQVVGPDRREVLPRAEGLVSAPGPDCSPLGSVLFPRRCSASPPKLGNQVRGTQRSRPVGPCHVYTSVEHRGSPPRYPARFHSLRSRPVVMRQRQRCTFRVSDATLRQPENAQFHDRWRTRHDRRRVVITGATGGLGSALVRLYTELGSDVAALVHTKRLDPDLAAENVREYVCDIADQEQVNATFEAVQADLGGIDALIHTVGVETKVAAADVGPDDIAKIFSVNFNGTVYCNQAAHRVMQSGDGGSIVNFHSMAGIKGFPMVAHYAASKSAVGGWTRTIAIEWGADNVRANAVAPIMLSPTMEGYLSSLSDEARQAFYEATRKDINLKEGQFGDPYSDIAPLVRFLAGDGSRYMTGQTISVDGGWVKLGS